MALNLKTLITRTITAAVFVVVLLLGICWNYISFSALFFLVSIWGLIEFYQLAEKLGAKPYKWLGIFIAILLFGYAFLSNTYSAKTGELKDLISIIPILAIAFTFILFILALFDSAEKPILNLSYTILGLVYAIVPFMLLLNISCINNAAMSDDDKAAPYSMQIILGIIFLIWASDVCAYLVGSLIGKHKLLERISPGKTWEGAIGAFILNIGCAFIIAHFFQELALKHWIVISILVSVFGSLGDLVESMFKRQAGIKDSGKIMPGHGGILDRFDSLLFVSPFVYAYLSLIK